MVKFRCPVCSKIRISNENIAMLICRGCMAQMLRVEMEEEGSDERNF